MKKSTILNQVMVFAFISAVNLHSQQTEVLFTYQSDVPLNQFSYNIGDEDDWKEIKTEKQSTKNIGSFYLKIDLTENCFVNLIATDEGEFEYGWYDIDICEAVSVSLYIDEDGETSFTVNYKEEVEKIE